MMSDIEISKKCNKKTIDVIGSYLGASTDDLEMYGKYKAKFSEKYIKEVNKNKNGKLILVTAINPTPAGEGKTTMTIGLGDALNKLGEKTVIALRQPSLGPVFGVKGGATGGGYSQVTPMEDINLHFTGDFHAITSAVNLLSALLDNHIHQGNTLNIDINTICIKRVLDMNDRVLRNITVGKGSSVNGIERNAGFEITVASEVMAVLCLSNDIKDLENKLGDIIVAYTYEGNPVFAKDLKANSSMTALLKDAILPNLIQTLEHTPCIMHGGPFANIAHGCNSIIATKLATKLADYTVTEAGFGADLGAEKFLDIKCRKADLVPNAIVLVATIRALKYNGGVEKESLTIENVSALKQGLCNLERHIENLKKYNVPLIVAINKFYKDTEEEIKVVIDCVETKGVQCIVSTAFENGSTGSINLANAVKEACNIENNFKMLYEDSKTIEEKINIITKEIYRASSVKYSDKALNELDRISKLNKNHLPICIAKTQTSFSDDKLKLGAPDNYEFSVTDIKLSNGAGFVVVYAGNVMTMPGLPKIPAAEKIGIDENMEIYGIF